MPDQTGKRSNTGSGRGGRYYQSMDSVRGGEGAEDSPEKMKKYFAFRYANRRGREARRGNAGADRKEGGREMDGKGRVFGAI